jgi:hypothetical protein
MTHCSSLFWLSGNTGGAAATAVQFEAKTGCSKRAGYLTANSMPFIAP